MSVFESTKVTPSKLLSGGGDGVRNECNKTLRTRTPVPSCRRFAARHERKDVKIKLEKALEEFKISKTTSSSRKVGLLRRSVTMAEINPSKMSTRKRLPVDELTSSSGANNNGRAKSCRDDAGRRVYQQLLLNSWRRKRTEVSALTESSRRLQEQVAQLEIQVSVLQKLRESESRRRSQAASESSLLRESLENHQRQLQELNAEKLQGEEKIAELEKHIEGLKTEVQNARNDWIIARNELKTFEQQNAREREKIGRLRKEKDTLVEKVSHKENVISDQKRRIRHLEGTLQETEISLQNVLVTSASQEEEKNIISQNLENEKKINASLQDQLSESKREIQKLEIKVFDLKKSLTEFKETNKKLKEDNQNVKKQAQELQNALLEEHRRPWWKNAADLAKAPLSALQTAAVVMLPALPQNLNKATSTTDIIVK